MLDEALSTLANVHRRRVLLSVLEHNPQEESATHIPEDVHVGEKELEMLRIELYHTRLPSVGGCRIYSLG